MNLRELSVKQWFFILFTIGLIVYIISGIVTRGITFEYTHSDHIGSILSDYYVSIFDSKKTYSEIVLIYPPMINLCYRIIAEMTIPFPTEAKALMGMFVPQFVLLVSYAVLVVLLAINLECYHKGNKKEKTIILLILVLSFPFIHSLARGNAIGFAVIFSGFFVYLYDSQDFKKRYLAYLFLALAINIKLYPVLFALLIIRSRRTYELLYLAITSALILFISLFLLNDSLIDYISNLFATGSSSAYWGVSVSSPIYFILSLIGCAEYTRIISLSIMAIILVITAYIVINIENVEWWKIMAILSLALSTCGTVNATYCLLYMMVPLILFINSNPEKNKMNIIYLIFFTLIFTPLIAVPYNGSWMSVYDAINFNLPTIMTIVLFSDILYNNIKNKNVNTTYNQSV